MARLLRIVALAAITGAIIVAASRDASAHGSTAGEGLRFAGANPSRGATTFAFRINHPMANVDLSLFDIEGRHVATLLNGPLGTGEHRLTFSRRGLPIGTYMVRLVTEHGIYHKLLVLIS